MYRIAVLLLLVNGLVATGLLSFGSGRAAVPAEGVFVVERACPAEQSFRRGTNPGAVMVAPGQRLVVFQANRAEASHYRVRVPSAMPVERWLAKDCGRLVRAGAEPNTGPTVSAGSRHVLAVNWQNAFCQTRPQVAECGMRKPLPAYATGFSLHGLWPQPRDNAYCGVDGVFERWSRTGAWHRLPPVGLGDALGAALAAVMPGVRSHLDRHQWVKHGTCFGTGQGSYFRASVALIAQLNASPVRALFAAGIGGRLTLAEIRQAFDAAFGPGAGQRVDVQCDRSSPPLIDELYIHLAGRIDTTPDLGALIRAAPPVRSDCAGGRIDAYGV